MSDTTKQSHPFITASIVSFNTAHLLSRCLTSIEQHVPNLRHIVIVNHSSEDIILPDMAIPTTIIIQENKGFGAGHNRAIDEILENHKELSTICDSSHHLHLFLNPDTLLTEDISPLYTHFNDKEVAAVGPQLISSMHAKDPHCTGAYPTFLRTLHGKLHTPQPPQTVSPVDWVSGASMLVRINDFITVNGFDEKYFLYFEDTDLCTRLKKHYAKKIIFDPTVTVTHESGQSFVSYEEQKQYYDVSQDYFFHTYYSPLHAKTQRFFRTIWRKIS